MKKNYVILSTATLLMVTYLIISPFITSYLLKEALLQKDGGALSEHIDFVSVKRSVKDQLNFAFAQQTSKKDEEDLFSQLGNAMGWMMVDKMVDSYVSPTGLINLLEDGKLNNNKKRTQSNSKASKNFENASIGYEGMNKFTIIISNPEGRTTLVLRRSGLSWVVKEVILPLD